MNDVYIYAAGLFIFSLTSGLVLGYLSRWTE